MFLTNTKTDNSKNNQYSLCHTASVAALQARSRRRRTTLSVGSVQQQCRVLMRRI